MSKMPAWADMVLIPLISLILAGLLSAPAMKKPLKPK